ncbi:UDP-glucose/GDP-mannose dehydrogenase family protein [Jatrophihabitans cynanchi]|uniref:UDP-glucose 6-dehydrogenase n=2 Tax=Jatrophihabitans cynanchi TaxID=2944128 RepID=A0ABY7K2A7_9ACTN|nr:UDP-glucose/GDP-mannose dehydrogenase family protein [Jatrophihabitans sp. SB3-54]WAX58638.1 UDP-glucose/GDP-mannose dehydrogenase family protein [Jatrophihabitans sp. SB3-54]
MDVNSPAAPAKPRISVIGTGYLGTTHAVCMAELGYDVIGLDVDAAKLDLLRAGTVPFFEPGLPELLTKVQGGGRLRFTDSYAEIAQFADVHFVCVGTPQRKGELAADLQYVEAAFSSLAPHLDRKVLVVGKSTVPAGTAVRMEQLLASQAPCKDVELAWNPEFLREGFAVQDTLHPDRLVLGVRTEWAEQQLRAVFAPMIESGTPVVLTDFATAELVKVAANSFLATKISFINAMAEVCEATGADVTKLAEAIGHDARIGRRFLNAGLGFGGGCLPKDIRAFIARAQELGVDQAVSFLHQVDAINLRRRARVVDLGQELLDGSWTDRRVAVLGAAFKPDSDDIRDSPALDVAAAIGRRGANVLVYDPQALDNARQLYPDLQYAASAEDAVRDADLVMLLTEWREFRDMSPERIGTLVRRRNIVDGRNVLDPAQWRAAGWVYRALGRQ